MANKKQAALNEKLIDAALYGLLGDLKEAVEKGADIDAKDEIDNTALIWAASTNQNKILKYLIEKKANPKVNNRIGWTPLICAANNNNFEGIQELVKLDVDVNKKDNNGMTALMFSSLKDYLQTVEVLLDNGADINIVDSNNQSAIFYAIDNHPADVARKLDDNNDSDISNYNNEKITLIEKLINAKSDLMIKNNHGNNALLFSIEKENIPAVKLILSKNIDITVKNKKGEDALDLAFKKQNLQIEQAIVRYIEDNPGLEKLKDRVEKYIEENRFSERNLFRDIDEEKEDKNKIEEQVEKSTQDESKRVENKPSKETKPKVKENDQESKPKTKEMETAKKVTSNQNLETTKPRREMQKRSFLNESIPINVIEGKIDYISSNDVIIEYNIKCRSRLSIEEFNPNNLPRVGDQFLTYVERIEKGGQELIVSRRKANFLMNYNRLNKVYKSKKSIPGVFTKILSKGMEISFDGIIGFLPQKEYSDYLKNNDLVDILGKTANFRITSLRKEEFELNVSRKKAYREELAQKRKLLKKKLEAEAELRGKVKAITDIGVYVDLGGIDGIIHVSDMPEDLVSLEKSFTVGQSINVKVVGYDQKKDILFLSLKQDLPKSWDYIVSKYNKGSRVKGKVVNFAKFGAFIELEPGLNGLVHISEMSWTKRINDPKQFLSLGDEIEAVVTKISHELEQINVSIKRTKENPWLNIDKKYPLGSKVKKEIVSVSSFGVFVSLEDDIEGLIHVNDLSWTTFEFDPTPLFQVGEEIETQVLTIDKPFHRIVLSYKHVKPDPWENITEDSLKEDEDVEVEILDKCSEGLIVKYKTKEFEVEGFIFSEDLVEAEIENPTDLFTEKEKIKVNVSRVDLEDHYLNFSLKDFFDNHPKLYSKFKKDKNL